MSTMMMMRRSCYYDDDGLCARMMSWHIAMMMMSVGVKTGGSRIGGPELCV